MLGVDGRQFSVIWAAATLDKEWVALVREKNVAYLFGCELYQGTFVALKGKREKWERLSLLFCKTVENNGAAARTLCNNDYAEVFWTARGFCRVQTISQDLLVMLQMHRLFNPPCIL